MYIPGATDCVASHTNGLQGTREDLTIRFVVNLHVAHSTFVYPSCFYH